jgi:hypothetical protein
MDNFLNFPDLLKFLEFPELTDLSYLLDFPDIPTLHQTASLRLKYIHCNPVQGRTGNKQGYPCNKNRIPAMITV